MSGECEICGNHTLECSCEASSRYCRHGITANNNGWIKCSDRLPDLDEPNGGSSQDVIVTDGQSIDIGYYESEYFIERDPFAYVGQQELYSSGGWNDCSKLFGEVKFWMPLPSKPIDE